MASRLSASPQIGSSNWRPVRLDTLVRLRWLAIVGQFSGVMVVGYVLNYDIPTLASLFVISVSAVLNLVLHWRYGSIYRLSNAFAGGLVGFDIVQLTSLLWLTGGLQNPFSLLLLAPISVAATTLNQRATMLLAGLTAVVITILALWHLPLPWDGEASVEFNPLYIFGLWAALLSGVGFISSYTNRVALEARQLAAALSATELALSRQQQLQALDGLAAAAAHELGTPLGTIALAAKDMSADLAETPLAEDAELIVEQVGRCRAILGKLRSLAAEGGDPFATVPLTELLSEVTRPYEQMGKTVLFDVEPHAGNEPVVPRAVGLLYGLGNLVENAVQFSDESVSIVARWDETHVELSIRDDGPGFALELISRLGEPYLTSRPHEQPRENPGARGGLGLGVFIAKTLLERSGARLTFLNTDPRGHACVRILWPRGALVHWHG